MELTQLREQICEKDLEIIRLISERTELARRIGAIKAENGLPIVDKTVEKRVIQRYLENGAESGLSSEVMSTVAEALIREAVNAECQIEKEHRQ